MKPILISGIQPTGTLHLGNYLGALKNFVALQNSEKYKCYFFVADMHALTENPESRNLNRNILNLAADFLTAGLNPDKSVIFQQSQVKSVQELKWILSTLTPVSELLRMTAFKEKVLQPLKPSEKEGVSQEKFDEIVEKANFGLAEYPILMAADILLYDARFVPVGEDQLQHLEFTRTVARKFNRRFGRVFKEPKTILTEAPRIMSLDDPRKKMSKSRPAGCLFLDDSPETVKKKIGKAVTDSGKEIFYDPLKKPAVSNLLLIYSELSGRSLDKIQKSFAGKGYAEFKESLAELCVAYFKPFREKKTKLKSHTRKLKAILFLGSKEASKLAEKKIAEVKRKIGVAL